MRAKRAAALKLRAQSNGRSTYRTGTRLLSEICIIKRASVLTVTACCFVCLRVLNSAFEDNNRDHDYDHDRYSVDCVVSLTTHFCYNKLS